MEAIAFLRCLFLMLFDVAGGTSESHCLPSMFDFDAMWCSRALGHFIVCIGCLILMLFVVAGHSLEVACSSCCQPELAYFECIFTVE